MGCIFQQALERENSTKIWTWTLLARRWLCSPLNHHPAAYRRVSAHKSSEVALRWRMCYAVKVVKKKWPKLNWTLNPGGADLPLLCAETMAEPGTVLPTHKKKKKKAAGEFFFDKTKLTAVNAQQQKPVCKRYSSIAICVPRIAEMLASGLDSGFRHFWHQRPLMSEL